MVAAIAKVGWRSPELVAIALADQTILFDNSQQPLQGAMVRNQSVLDPAETLPDWIKQATAV
jgi:hypothetical protein